MESDFSFKLRTANRDSQMTLEKLWCDFSMFYFAPTLIMGGAGHTGELLSIFLNEFTG